MRDLPGASPSRLSTPTLRRQSPAQRPPVLAVRRSTRYGSSLPCRILGQARRARPDAGGQRPTPSRRRREIWGTCRRRPRACAPRNRPR
jgi:hypothetical protein